MPNRFFQSIYSRLSLLLAALFIPVGCHTPSSSQLKTQASSPATSQIAPQESSPPRRSKQTRLPGYNLPALQPRLGEPLADLSPDQLKRFSLGLKAFNKSFTREEGLGPTHNLFSCGACHSNPAGGSGTITVTMFGRATKSGYDPLKNLGGPLLQSEYIQEGCAETVPAQANVAAERITTSTLGSGLIEAVADSDILAIAENPVGSVHGRAHLVRPLEDAPDAPMRVGRFGWKSQVATVLTFSAAAALKELGITNRLLPNEVAPNGNKALLKYCDTIPDPEDRPDAEGVDLVTRMTDFQRYLAGPPQTPRSGMTGERIFMKIGCGDCHVPELTTSSDPQLEEFLRGKKFRPYSDFLLHDMGQYADGIKQGQARRNEIRTTPLWGFRIRFPVWHDGRVTGRSMPERFAQTIELHTGSATESAEKYRALSTIERTQLVAFIDSLGRVEFDNDGDNDVDLADHVFLSSCFTGVKKGSYTPDDRCAIADVDQDSDIDLADYSLFQRAFTGKQYGSAIVVP